MRFLIIPLMILICLASCRPNEKEQEIPVIDLNQKLSDRNYKLSEIASSIEYIFLDQSNKDSYFDKPYRVKISKNWIIINDAWTEKLYLFNRKGDFISNISKKGKGPGEYILISDFSIDASENYIYLLTNDSYIKQFMFTNKFVKSIKLDERPSRFEILEDGFLFLNVYPFAIQGDQYCTFFTTDQDGSILDKLMWRDPNKHNGSGSRRPGFYRFEDTYCLWENRDTIYEITDNIELYPRWILINNHIKKIDNENVRDRTPNADFTPSSIRETNDLLIFQGFHRLKAKMIIYNKKTNELSEVSTIYKNRNWSGVENDIIGGPPFQGFRQINNKTLFSLYSPGRLNSYMKDNFTPCKNPEQREKLKRRAIDSESWVLMLVHLK